MHTPMPEVCPAMKALQIPTDRADDPAVAAVRRRFGNAGVGALFQLWLYVGRQGRATGRNGSPLVGWALDEKRRPLRLDDMAAAVGVEVDYLTDLLTFCAERDHIDPVKWGKKIVVFAWMIDQADEYTRRQVRENKADNTDLLTGHSPESVRSLSAGGKLQVPVERERISQGSRSKTGTRKRRTKTPPDGYASPWFDRFWSAWPTGLKAAKKAALRAWFNLDIDERIDREQLTDQIVAAVQAHAEILGWGTPGGQWPPNPATWLNGERWTDELEKARPARPVLVKRGNQGATGAASDDKQDAYANLQKRAVEA